jgi:hypothetical protein
MSNQATLKGACTFLIRSTANVYFKASRKDMPGFTCANGLCKLAQIGQYADAHCAGKCSPPPSGCSSPSDCNGAAHGDCVDGKCKCKPGFAGDHCELGACILPADCNNRGHCIDNQCTCSPQWSGRNCKTFTCIGKDHHGDCQTLTALYDSMGGKSWGLSHWFKPGTSFCEWTFTTGSPAKVHSPITCDYTKVAAADQTVCTGGTAATQADGPPPPVPLALYLAPCNAARASQQFSYSKSGSAHRIVSAKNGIHILLLP